MKLADVLSAPGRPVAYFPRLRALTGSVNATILLCQLIYWHGKQRDADGWIHKRVEPEPDDLDGELNPGNQSIQRETGLSYHEQARARRLLRERGFLRERQNRLEHRVHFQLDLQAVERAWTMVNDGQARESRSPIAKTATGDREYRVGQSRNPRLGIAETAIGDVVKRASIKGINREYTESTAESTTESPAPAPSEEPTSSFPEDQADEAIPTTPVEAMNHPDIRMFQEVCGRVPGARHYRTVIETMRYFRRVKREAVVTYLQPFWLAWSARRRASDGQPYDPGAMTWLTEWALNGTIPPEQRGEHAAHSRGHPAKPLSADDLAAAEQISALQRQRARRGREARLSAV